jgi:signal transduction histidine kinase
MKRDGGAEASMAQSEAGPGRIDKVTGEFTGFQSPAWLLLLTAAAIFITEIVVMLILFGLPALAGWAYAFIDGLLLTFLLFPILHFFLFKPMQAWIADLSRTQARLQAEIAERKQLESVLRESERELRNLSSDLLLTQERERRRVSKELHEELGQSLAAVKLGLRSIKQNWRRAKPEIREEWEQNMNAIDRAIADVRRISRALSPSIVEELGLSAALQGKVNSLMNSSGIIVSLDLMNVDPAFSQKSQMIIYRILQEALSNVERHSEATHVTVTIRREEGGFFFEVEDNGKGFDPKQPAAESEKRKGLGFTTMRKGAQMIGGRLTIWSEGGRGTKTTLSVPIELSADTLYKGRTAQIASGGSDNA